MKLCGVLICGPNAEAFVFATVALQARNKFLR